MSDRLKGNAVPQAEIDRALAYLDYLPNEQQPDLNEKLRETASELDTVGLAEPLGAIRAILPPKDAAEWDEKFNRFDGDCRALKSLIDQHDFCTIVDGALREADGLPGATAGALSQWADAVQCLGGLATGRPAHKATQRLVESATRFAAADAADSGRLFEALRGRFVNVFFEIDSELLDATVRVITSAELLDTLLGRYR